MLDLPKSGLAVLPKQLSNGDLVTPFDFLIEIDKLPTEKFGQGAPGRSLAASHESGERDDGIQGFGVPHIGCCMHDSVV